MSLEVVSEVIAKALLDAGFRGQLFAEPATALAGYDLTEEERAALGKMKPEALDAFSSQVEERISKVTPINLPYPAQLIDRSSPEVVSREIQLLLGSELKGCLPIPLP